MERTEKKCSKCQASHPITEFHKNSARYDGYGNTCKSCKRAQNEARRQELTELRDVLVDKTCKQCSQQKPIGEFVRNYSYKDGYLPVCKICDRKNQIAKSKLLTEGTKQCHQCKETKPVSYFQFTKSSKDGLHYKCRACVKVYHDSYYARNAESIRAKSAEYQRNNPHVPQKSSRRFRIHSYGLTEERYQLMLDSQQNCCLSCGREFQYSSRTDKPQIDHCHQSNRVRGLLCGICNMALGLLGENPTHIRALARYAENHCHVSTQLSLS